MREHRLDDSSLVRHGSSEWTPISKLRKEFPKGGYIYKTGKTWRAIPVNRNISMLAYGELSLQLLHLLPVYNGKNRIEEIALSTALSILLPSVIKSEWRKKRSFSALGLISAIVLVFLIAYLGVHWYWIIGGII
jgi:hypothetical protein